MLRLTGAAAEGLCLAVEVQLDADVALALLVLCHAQQAAAVGCVLVFAVQEHDHVRVLLDLAG